MLFHCLDNFSCVTFSLFCKYLKKPSTHWNYSGTLSTLIPLTVFVLYLVIDRKRKKETKKETKTQSPD